MGTKRRIGSARALSIGRAVLEAEAEGLRGVAARLDPRFVAAARAIAGCEGRLVVTGMGKAGFVAQKISATFASTGRPSLFVHPADALHGDLGRIAASDVVLAISHSGETEELVRLIGPLKRVGAKLVAITATARSSLGVHADVTIEIGRQVEAGNGLAPTTSTTVMLGVGDALAMLVVELSGFTAEEFALFHPGGALGKRLMRVADVMRKGEMLPVAKRTAKLRAVIAIMTETKGRPGAATVVDGRGRLVGVFTDGDLRRGLESGRFDPEAPVHAAMTKDPVTVRPEILASEAARVLSEYHIDQVPVVDGDHRPVGLLDVQDLLAMRFL